jgi:Tfp pilus assembly protein PilF
LRYYIIALIFFAAGMQAVGQANTQRVYSSADPMYKYNIDSAFALLDNKDFAHAIPFLQAALKITDKSYSTTLKLAGAFNKTEQTDKCFEILHKLCNTHWDLLSAFFEQQENSSSFMFANLVADKRWAGLKQCLKLKRQDYLEDLETAHLLMHQGKYAEAIPHLTAALQMEDKTHLIEIELATAYYKTGQADRCFEVLNKTANDWEWMNDFIKSDNEEGFAFANLVRDSRWTKLKARIDSMDIQQSAGHNRELMHTLKEIQRTDQLYRNAMPSSEHPQMSTSLKDSIWKLQTVTDSLNLLKVIAVFKQYGYPGDSLVGSKYNATAWLVIQHAGLKYQEQYLPLIKAAAEKNQLPMSDVALLIDRIEMGNNRPQVYGSQINCDLNNKCTVYKILDEANVNKRRASAGLIPLQDYLSYWGIIWAPPK